MQGQEPKQIYLVDENWTYKYEFFSDTLSLWFNFLSIFEFQLQRKPDIFVMRQDQNMGFIQAQGDILLSNFQTKKKAEIDEIFQLGEIKACINAF